MTTAPTDPIEPALALFGGEVASDPHAAYRMLRDRCPVARSELGGMPGVYLFRYEDVLWALRHPEFFSSDVEALSIGQEQPLIPLQIDPPDHIWYRRLLNPEFVPRKVAELEPDVRKLVNGLIDGFAPRGECDFHEEFATPMPSTVFLRLMGLPQEDLPKFLQWRDNIIRPDVAPGDLQAAAEIRAATGKAINGYFEQALAARREVPDDGLLSALVAIELDGRALDQAELLGICQLMLLGGLDTVTATLDCCILYLARHPERRAQLVANPGLIPGAVEELLRQQSPVMVVPRVAHREMELGGVTIRPGDHVTLVLGSANSDEAEFSDPEETDFTRDPNRHLAFGAGNHLCLGAHLARLELRVALEEFHRRIPDYDVVDGEAISFSPGIRQANRLPLTFPPTTG